MSDWKTIDTLPDDGRLVMCWSPLGGCYICPATVPAKLSPAEVRTAAKLTATIPHLGWNATHWIDLPEGPQQT